MISLLLKFSTEKSESRTVYWPLAVCRGSNYNPRQIQCKFSSVHVKQSNKNHHQYVRAGQSPPLYQRRQLESHFVQRAEGVSREGVQLSHSDHWDFTPAACLSVAVGHVVTGAQVCCAASQCGTLTHRGVRGQCEDECWRWLELTRTSSESPALSGPVATHHCHTTSQVVSTSGRQGPCSHSAYTVQH